jgi:hypothetical protein
LSYALLVPTRTTCSPGWSSSTVMIRLHSMSISNGVFR